MLQISTREYSNGKESIEVIFSFWTGAWRATEVTFSIGDKLFSYQRPTAAEKKLEANGFHYVQTVRSQCIN